MATAFSLDRFLKADKLDQARAVEKGLPVKAVTDLMADKVVSMADLAQVVAPRRTLDRRLKANAPLSPEESDRLATFASVLAEATRLFGSRSDAMRWLSGPKRAFDGERPIDLLRTRAGARAVEEFFIRASHGMLA
jgi:putative toxin-antitoxin system antitoxin component (TIGR02293 family)